MEAVNVSIENLAELQARLGKQLEAAEYLILGGILRVPEDIELSTLQERIGRAFVKSMRINTKVIA